MNNNNNNNILYFLYNNNYITLFIKCIKFQIAFFYKISFN